MNTTPVHLNDSRRRNAIIPAARYHRTTSLAVLVQQLFAALMIGYVKTTGFAPCQASSTTVYSHVRTGHQAIARNSV